MAAAKKSSKGKTAKAVKIEKIVNAPPGKEFFLVNGKKIKNFKELATVMEDIEEHVFRHHVNAERNDFANWTRDVFNDIELAKKIAGVDSKEKLQLILYKKIVKEK